MAAKLARSITFLIGLVAFVPVAAQAGSDAAPLDKRIDELKAMKKEMRRTIQDFDARIKKLEAELQRAQSAKLTAQKATVAAPQAISPAAEQVAFTADDQPIEASPASPPPKSATALRFGDYVPNRGFIIASGDKGLVAFGLVAYLRYLNQTSLAPRYTDAFGRTTNVKLRDDLFPNKVIMNFAGWLLNPNLDYRAFAWTQNAAQGLGAQVVLAASAGYRFNKYVHVGAGVGPVPTTRSTNSSYMYWLKVDNRTVADEFFRGSYTFGAWVDGKLADDIGYKVMAANNLSALGINAARLSAGLNTISSAVWWMPTTGEFGTNLGFGDYDDHQELATLFGIHYTHSRENRQEQPGTDDFDNSQIRLSDGTLLFSANPFNTHGFINDATYQMVDANAGFKYRGWSLEGEYYARWLGNFQAAGLIPVTNLFDQGFQLQTSTMILRKRLQFYVSGSAVYGQYGDPWDVGVGLNWYPFAERPFRINSQAVHLYHSPVGALSYPYVVGGTGWFYNTDVTVSF